MRKELTLIEKGMLIIFFLEIMALSLGFNGTALSGSVGGITYLVGLSRKRPEWVK